MNKQKLDKFLEKQKQELLEFLSDCIDQDNKFDKISNPTLKRYEENSNGYGWLDWTGRAYHPGIDYNRGSGNNDLGDPVYAVADGVVTYTGKVAGWGNHMFIKHENINHPRLGQITFWSHYAHLNRFSVQLGSKVLSGQKIATVGNTGASTASHLHFELRRRPLGVNYYPNGKSKNWVKENYYNPITFIPND
jgi:murein DD-endopeptidase MepM/ murein hydrolase activator NlpD